MATGGSADIPVCGFTGHSCPVFHETGDWKVARTRRLESLRYGSVHTLNFGVRVEIKRLLTQPSLPFMEERE